MTATIDSRQFRAGFSGRTVAPGEEGYDSARAVWNGMIDRRPALIARCSSTDEVVAAVQRGDPARRRVDVLVVTADRGLRDRVTPLGALCIGPRWLTDRLD